MKVTTVLNMLKSSYHQSSGQVSYSLQANGGQLNLNELIGKSIQLKFEPEIQCLACQRKIKKTFNQGYCFPCFRSLARCDMCILKPETCHFRHGTCREESWALNHCIKPHIVYLSYTSNFKVGITRKTNIPYRWIDQGALKALPLYEVSERFHAGLIEKHLASFIDDKTHWRNMLKLNDASSIDMIARSQALIENSKIDAFIKSNTHLQLIPPTKIIPHDVYSFIYPTKKTPTTTNTIKLDTNHAFTSTLEGIKGQYLLFEHGTINIRKYGGYLLTLQF